MGWALPLVFAAATAGVADGCGRAGFGVGGPGVGSGVVVQSACECLQLCSEDPVAQAWQWISKPSNHDYRTCYLKSTPDLEPNSASVAGSLKGRPGGKIWSFATGGPVDCTPTLSSDGKVVYVGSDDNNLYAVNTSTGRKMWSFATGGEVYSVNTPPVLSSDGEVVYVGYGNLHAVNALNGSKIWSFPSGLAVESSAVLSSDGKVVYFASDDGHLYAVNTDGRGRPPGTKIWSFLADKYVSSPTLSSDGKVVYVQSDIGDPDPGDLGNLYAVNALTGSKIWSFATGGSARGPTTLQNKPGPSPPVLSSDGKVVYVGSVGRGPAGSGLHAINALTGSNIWNSANPDGVSSPVLSSDGKIVYVGGIGGNAYAVNASTGSTIWTFATGTVGVDSSPVVSIDGKVLYFWTWPDEEHYTATVFAANAVTGRMLWSFETGGSQPLGGPVKSPPTLSSDGKVMYVGSDDNNLYALNTSTGRKIWSFGTGGYSIGYSSPTLSRDNKVVYFGREDNNLYAFYA